MELFINEGVYERRWNGNVKIEELNTSLKLLIPNYLAAEKKHEYIKFIFSDISEKDLLKDNMFEGVSLVETSKNTYYVEKSEENTHMYALLRATGAVPDEIFIPASMKDRVEVIRRIRFVDDEADYGDFLSNVYLIKIKLNIGESLPVYLAYENAQVLTEHYVFSKPSWYPEYRVSEKLKTYILLDKHNKGEYIPLSSLIIERTCKTCNTECCGGGANYSCDRWSHDYTNPIK